MSDYATLSGRLFVILMALMIGVTLASAATTVLFV